MSKSIGTLPSAEQRVYELVARRYLAQFLPSFEFHETRIEIEAAGERLRATGRQTIVEGWTAVCQPLSPESGDDGDGRRRASNRTGKPLPLLDEGATVTVDQIAIVDRRTAAPRRFTDASLIQAMTGIARFVEDPAIKKVLAETDGLGTPATQAHVIETLFDRRFIERRGRQIVSTAIGRGLIEALPDAAGRPDMTALWEAAMRRIVDGKLLLPAFTGMVDPAAQRTCRKRSCARGAGGRWSAPAARDRRLRPALSRGSRSASARHARR